MTLVLLEHRLYSGIWPTFPQFFCTLGEDEVLLDDSRRYANLTEGLTDRLNSTSGKAWLMYSPPTYPSFELPERRSIMSVASSDNTYRRRGSRLPKNR